MFALRTLLATALLCSVSVESLKCFHCDSRVENCTSSLQSSKLMQCNRQAYVDAGLGHMVSERSEFVCFEAIAQAEGHTILKLTFKGCGPKDGNPCRVVMPEEEEDPSTTSWMCLSCNKDGCNSSGALTAGLIILTAMVMSTAMCR